MLTNEEVSRVVGILVSILVKRGFPYSISFSELMQHIEHADPVGVYDKIRINSEALMFGVLVSSVSSTHPEYFDYLFVRDFLGLALQVLGKILNLDVQLCHFLFVGFGYRLCLRSFFRFFCFDVLGVVFRPVDVGCYKLHYLPP